jgi:hypothetical protein
VNQWLSVKDYAENNGNAEILVSEIVVKKVVGLLS